MKRKYIEERYPMWTKYNTDLPENVVEEYNEVVERLVEAIMLFFELYPQEAEKFYYG